MEFATPRPTFHTPGDPDLFRMHPAVRLSGALLMVACGLPGVGTALLALLADTKPQAVVFWTFTLAFALLAAATHRFTFHPMVQMERDGLRVRNVRFEHLLEWHDIAGVRPGYWGLTITLRSSRPVCAFALQKSNYAAARGLQETGSDLAARRLMERATGDPTHPGVALPSEAEQKASAKRARIIIGLALTFFVVVNVLDRL